MSSSFQHQPETLIEALIKAREAYGDKEILEDQDRKPLTYTGLIRALFVLGRKLAAFTGSGERVGILLPSSMGVVVTFFGLHAFGRTPVMLNFTAGQRNVRSACKTAGVKRVLTARRFIQQAKLDELIAALEGEVEIVWLDDIRATIGLGDKLFGLMAGLMPRRFAPPAQPSDPGVILFTSGSFGAPKGVLLSQENLVANARQVAAHIELAKDWVFFNPLPTFHCFGLTGGVLLPILEGLKAFQYPSPLHAKQITALLPQVQASVLMTTDTFLNHYIRAGEPGAFASLAFIVAGAEKVKPQTRELFASRCGDAPLLEGYGVTETSPVAAVNHPDRNRPGTVGQLLPGIEARVEPVEGIDRGGRLFLRGPNVMAGYLSADNPGTVEPPRDGWHDTGDIVGLDAERYLEILGRAKRFAKIAGEMVSLAAVEGLAGGVWPQNRHAVVSVPDAKKGERLVLVTDNAAAELGPLSEWARAHGAADLAVPRKIVKVAELPVLGTGKTDYVAIQRMVETEARAA